MFRVPGQVPVLAHKLDSGRKLDERALPTDSLQHESGLWRLNCNAQSREQSCAQDSSIGTAINQEPFAECSTIGGEN